jgi:hypothetical protein
MLNTNRSKWRSRQFLFSVALMAPVVVAIATAPPFAAEPRAAGTTHMLGPLFPIVAGSDNITPTRSGTSVTVHNRWSCGAATEVLNLSNPDSTGHFLTESRVVGSRTQSVTFGGIVAGAPHEFTVDETAGGALLTRTRVELVDQNSDGATDGAVLSGKRSAAVSFAYTPDSNYISIPWAQASAVGIDTTPDCGGAVPQIWIPLADTNGDGRGDSIVLDLDGNGAPDPDELPGPVVVVPAVPSMGPIGRLILMTLVGLIGAWFLSRRQSDTLRPSSTV